MKQHRKIFALAAVVVLALGALYVQFSRFKTAPSLYEQAAVRTDVRVQVQADTAQNRILYRLENLTAQPIDYDHIPALEYREGQAWREVLTRRGNRRWDGARTAEGHFLPPSEVVQGEVVMQDLPRLRQGTYRLVFPGVSPEDAVICSEPFQWGNGA